MGVVQGATRTAVLRARRGLILRRRRDFKRGGEEAAVAVAGDLVDDLAVDVGDGEVDLEGEVEGLVDELFCGGMGAIGEGGGDRGGRG